jgi:hypothetical protein
VGNVRFEVRALGLWDRPVTDPRARSSRFKASWDGTIALLLREVEYLDGTLVVVQVDADPGEIRRDGMLRARARVNFPGVKVSFGSAYGPLTYATDAYDQQGSGGMAGWQANVRAVALGLEALRAVDRYGVTRRGEQYQGWTAIAAKAAESDMTPDEARRVLADASGADAHLLNQPATVVTAYRRAAKTAHPDAGGNADVFRLIGKARDVLLGQ